MSDVTMKASARFSNLVARRFPALGRSATARQVESTGPAVAARATRSWAGPCSSSTLSAAPAANGAPSC